MSTSGYKEDLASRLADYIGVTKEHIPTVRLVNPSSGKVVKYIMEEEITSENIIQFFKEFEEGKLEPHVKSEPIPEEQD